jgi:hypothetical protein
MNFGEVQLLVIFQQIIFPPLHEENDLIVNLREITIINIIPVIGYISLLFNTVKITGNNEAADANSAIRVESFF